MLWSSSSDHLPKEETYVSSVCVAEMCWQLLIRGMHQGCFFCCLLTAKVQSHTGQEDDSLANQKVTGTITIADDNGWR